MITINEAYIGDRTKDAIDSWRKKNPRAYLALQRMANTRKTVKFLNATYKFFAVPMYLNALDGLGSLVIGGIAADSGKAGAELKEAGLETTRQGILIALTLMFPGMNGSWVVQGLSWVLQKLGLMKKHHADAILRFLKLGGQDEGEMGRLFKFSDYEKVGPLVVRKKKDKKVGIIAPISSARTPRRGTKPKSGESPAGKVLRLPQTKQPSQAAVYPIAAYGKHRRKVPDTPKGVVHMVDFTKKGLPEIAGVNYPTNLVEYFQENYEV